MLVSISENTAAFPAESACANGNASSGVHRPPDVSRRRFRAVVHHAVRNRRVIHRLTNRHGQRGTVEITQTAPNDCCLIGPQRPRKSHPGTKVIAVRLVGLQWISFRPKVHQAQIGRILQVDEFHRDIRRGRHLGDPVIVPAQAEVQDEPAAQAPIVLNERTVLVHVRTVRRRAVRGVMRVHDVRESVGIVVVGECGIFRIDVTAGLAHEAESRLHEMPLIATAEFLLETVGRTRHVQDFGVRRAEQAADAEGRHAPAVRHDLGWLVRPDDRQELVETRQVRLVPSNAAFRHPCAARHHILRGDAILPVRKLSIVHAVRIRSRFERERPKTRVSEGEIRPVEHGHVGLGHDVIFAAPAHSEPAPSADLRVHDTGGRDDRLGRQIQRVQGDPRLRVRQGAQHLIANELVRHRPC